MKKAGKSVIPSVPKYTLRQLAYLVAAAETGSIAHAAAALHLSSSAVTDALNELERVVGAPLTVRRKAKGLTLTPTGSRLVRDARELLAQAGSITQHLDAPDGVHAGPIVVACYPTLAPLILPVLIDDFAGAYPFIELHTVDLSHDGLAGRIESGEVDVAFLYDTLVPGNPQRRELLRAHAHVLLSPDDPRAANAHVRLDDLASSGLILFDVAPSSEHTLSLFAAHQLTPNIRYRTSNFEAVRALVARGLGYSIAVQRIAHPYSYEGRELVTRELTPRVAPVGIDVVWSSDRPTPGRVQALIDFALSVDWSRGSLRGKWSEPPTQ
ncbi:MAG: LysR family transcriptional regulator [Microbacteriaceae bacterium]|nr:LysR family transcriptional regulator [Microbacteriaceae bacterium]